MEARRCHPVGAALHGGVASARGMPLCWPISAYARSFRRTSCVVVANRGVISPWWDLAGDSPRYSPTQCGSRKPATRTLRHREITHRKQRQTRPGASPELPPPGDARASGRCRRRQTKCLGMPANLFPTEVSPYDGPESVLYTAEFTIGPQELLRPT